MSQPDTREWMLFNDRGEWTLNPDPTITCMMVTVVPKTRLMEVEEELKATSEELERIISG